MYLSGQGLARYARCQTCDKWVLIDKSGHPLPHRVVSTTPPFEERCPGTEAVYATMRIAKPNWHCHLTRAQK